jgi:antitoxin ParD1/3/4
MPETERTTIVLTEAMAEEIRKAVEAGEYASTSEAVRHGVRMWMDERAQREKKLEWLRAEIQKGIDSGFAEPFEPGTFLQRVKAKAGATDTEASAKVRKRA